METHNSDRGAIARSLLGIATLCFGLALLVGAGPPKKSWPRAVQKAFKTIKTKECRDHVTVLASDAFEGRAAGEDGGRHASEYIAMRFVENGIAPGGPGGSYFQRFPILLTKEREGKLEHSNYLRLVKAGSKTETFDLFDDVLPTAVSGELVSGGPLRYVSGEGAAEEALPDDLEGTFALISEATYVAELARTPPPVPAPPVPEKGKDAEGETPKAEPPKAEPPKADPPRPLSRWVEAGVRGILIVSEDKDHPGFDPESWPAGDRKGAARLPVLRLGPKATSRLLRKGSTTAVKAEKASRVNFKEWKAFISISRRGHPYGLGRNVVGMLPGTDPELAEEMVVIGAHFDHVGFAKDPRLTKGKSGEIHNGADDNASGSSGLIELSEAFSTQPKVERARTLIFIAFDAEELGLVGSNYYVAHCPHPIDKTVAMLNMDMISRNGPQEMYYGKDSRFTGLNRIVEGVGDYFKIYLDRTGMEEYMDRSDQAAFIAKGIPAVFLYGGDHPQYHTERDDIELINPIKIQNIARFMFLCAYDCANHRGTFKD